MLINVNVLSRFIKTCNHGKLNILRESLVIRLFYLFSSNRVCNGSRYWEDNPDIEALPEYECAAYGQDQYRTFDNKWIAFESPISCQYKLMGIKGTDHTVTISNEYCEDSLELLICKAVQIQTAKGTIKLLQKSIGIKTKNYEKEINPGEYPQPCQRSSVRDAEIFSIGLFTIVRVFSSDDPFKPLYEVG